jgi:hypothetical protein
VSETTRSIFEAFFDFVQGMFAETSILLFLAGLALFLGGLALIALSLYIRIKGYRVRGKLLGAIAKKRNNKNKSGKTVSGSFTPIFEYQRPDGSIQQTRASEGGSYVLKYKTGQLVNLVVYPHDGYDAVYDADKKTGIYIGIVILIIGALLMERGASLYASLSVSTLTLSLILLSIAARFLTGRKKKRKSTVKNKLAEKARHYTHFNQEDVLPIEELVQ